jgi:drug efflux transport system ATP-binding protein
VTIIISTPYLDEAERCTRVGLMYRGELIACDTPSQLRAQMGALVLEAQSSDAVRARNLIQAQEGVLSVSAHGDMIRLLVDRVERQEAIAAAWQSQGVVAQNLRVVRSRLEDAFVLMLSHKADDGKR